MSAPADIEEAREEAISYAAYRLLRHRFQESPGAFLTVNRLNTLFADLGYDASFTSTDYESGPPAALGNYIAQELIAFGLQDGSNEQFDYANQFYVLLAHTLTQKGTSELSSMVPWPFSRPPSSAGEFF